jgi:hypothetical protein
MDERIDIKKLSDLIPLRLKIARIARGYKNRSAFANRCGIAVTTYRAHERGDYEIKVSDLLCYTQTLDISVVWLLTGEGHPLDHHSYPDPEALALFLYFSHLEQSKAELKQYAAQEAERLSGLARLKADVS